MVRRELLLASALLGVAACGSSCEHVGGAHHDPLAVPRELDTRAIAELLWPVRAEGSWDPLSSARIAALERLVLSLLDHAELGELDEPARANAAKLARFARLELSALEVGEVRLWLVSEPADRVRGAGAYLIRRGPARPVLLSAPHSFFDQGTGDIALALMLEPSDPRAVPRALFVNTVHRYRQLDGSKVNRKQFNPADSAHADGHPLAIVTRGALEHLPLTLVQVHGYGREVAPGEPVAILSAGGDPTAHVEEVARSLRLAAPEFEFGVFGVDVDRLGGTTNVQARAAREFGRCFVHLELSRMLRERLLAEPALRERIGRGLLVVPRDPSDCR